MVATKRQRAIEWMNTHSQAMDLFRKFAIELADRNKSFGINLLRERVRWETHFEYDDSEEYKFNDHHAPYIARRLAYEIPKLMGLMNFCSTSDEVSDCIQLITNADMGLPDEERSPGSDQVDEEASTSYETVS